MQEKEQPRLLIQSEWIVYIVRCRDGCYYTGITTNLTRRIAEHNSPIGGAKYTRSRRPVILVYYETARSRSTATQRECQIKKMTARGKAQLIANPSLSSLTLPSEKLSAEKERDNPPQEQEP